MTNIYILSKSYHELMFVFCSLFIGRQKGQYVYMCRHTLSHTQTHTNTQHEHEYSTQTKCLILYHTLV